MKKTNKQSGFTVVELLISLFIAAAFLLSGYQLYNAAIKDGGETRANTIANNTAYEYLQRYKTSSSIPNPCNVITSTTTNLFNNTVTVIGLPSNTTVNVIAVCPYYNTVTSIAKIISTITYGTPQQTVSISTYVKL